MDKNYTVSVLYKSDTVCCIWTAGQRIIKIANFPLSEINPNQFNVNWQLFEEHWKEFVTKNKIFRIDKLILHHPVFCILPAAYYAHSPVSAYLQALYEGVNNEDITHVKLDDLYYLIYSFPAPLKRILSQNNTVIQVQHLTQRLYEQYLSHFSSSHRITLYFDGYLSYYLATSGRGLHLMNAYRTIDKYDRLYFALLIKKISFQTNNEVGFFIYNNGLIDQEESKMFQNYFKEVSFQTEDLDIVLLKHDPIIEY